MSKLKHENHKTKDQYIWEYSGNQMYAQEYLENQMKVCGAALTITNRTAPFLSPRARYSKIWRIKGDIRVASCKNLRYLQKHKTQCRYWNKEYICYYNIMETSKAEIPIETGGEECKLLLLLLLLFIVIKENL